jgi:hypothetical protein
MKLGTMEEDMSFLGSAVVDTGSFRNTPDVIAALVNICKSVFNIHRFIAYGPK